MNKNSLDALRLVAAIMVLHSHQYALLGLLEPTVMPQSSLGDAGVAIFFFLSGFLVWTSWARDPNAKRFFQRRCLRIFPALWVLCLASVFVLGPLASVLSGAAYFGSAETWRYLGTALLVSSKTLPGLFPENAIPYVVNGSLWTLPLEFLCYGTVAMVGMGWTVARLSRGTVLSLCVLAVVLLASYGPQVIGPHFIPHLEMLALFWWGALYGHGLTTPQNNVSLTLAAVALLGYAVLSPRGMERTVMLLCAALLVHMARNTTAGASLTDRLGDLSYGVYIFAFPVQQMGVCWGRGHGWSFPVYLSVSLLVTCSLAYASWHVVEKRALLLKPKRVEIP